MCHGIVAIFDVMAYIVPDSTLHDLQNALRALSLAGDHQGGSISPPWKKNDRSVLDPHPVSPVSSVALG
jgi:hypothetical protein